MTKGAFYDPEFFGLPAETPKAPAPPSPAAPPAVTPAPAKK